MSKIRLSTYTHSAAQWRLESVCVCVYAFCSRHAVMRCAYAENIDGATTYASPICHYIAQHSMANMTRCFCCLRSAAGGCAAVPSLKPKLKMKNILLLLNGLFLPHKTSILWWNLARVKVNRASFRCLWIESDDILWIASKSLRIKLDFRSPFFRVHRFVASISPNNGRSPSSFIENIIFMCVTDVRRRRCSTRKQHFFFLFVSKERKKFSLRIFFSGVVSANISIGVVVAVHGGSSYSIHPDLILLCTTQFLRLLFVSGRQFEATTKKIIEEVKHFPLRAVEPNRKIKFNKFIIIPVHKAMMARRPWPRIHSRCHCIRRRRWRRHQNSNFYFSLFFRPWASPQPAPNVFRIVCAIFCLCIRKKRAQVTHLPCDEATVKLKICFFVLPFIPFAFLFYEN